MPLEGLHFPGSNCLLEVGKAPETFALLDGIVLEEVPTADDNADPTIDDKADPTAEDMVDPKIDDKESDLVSCLEYNLGSCLELIRVPAPSSEPLGTPLGLSL